MAGLIFDLVSLHGQLAHVEFTQEQLRIEQKLVARLVALACGFVAFLLVNGVLLAAAWDSPYRILAALALPSLNGLMAVFAWRRYRTLDRIPDPGFAVSRRELKADLTLLGRTP